MKFKNLILIFLLLLTELFTSIAQRTPDKDKGVTGGLPKFKSDSTIIFTSPRPLLTLDETMKQMTNGAGINIIFSESGFGFGGFWKKYYGQNYALSIDLNFSEATNSDELPSPDYKYGQYLVAFKKNRLYNIPLTVSLQKYFFQNVLLENLKPFIIAGAGPSFIFASPYYKYIDSTGLFEYKDFFASLKEAKLYTRFGGFVGIGADFGKTYKNFYSFSIKYYYIPFGGDGIESMYYNPPLQLNVPPIKNFGGIQLNISFGLKY